MTDLLAPSFHPGHPLRRSAFFFQLLFSLSLVAGTREKVTCFHRDSQGSQLLWQLNCHVNWGHALGWKRALPFQAWSPHDLIMPTFATIVLTGEWGGTPVFGCRSPPAKASNDSWEWLKLLPPPKCFITNLETAFFPLKVIKFYQQILIFLRCYKNYVKIIVLTIAPLIEHLCPNLCLIPDGNDLSFSRTL